MAEQLVTVIGARKALGELLAQYRVSAGHGQHGFVEVLNAANVYLSRSSIANIERGRQRPSEELCKAADKVCAAGGEIVQAYQELERLEAQLASKARAARPAAWRQDDHHTPTDAVIHRALAFGADTPVQATNLESRVIDAHRQLVPDRQLSLTLVGGYAGSGKSEFGRFLSSVTGWAFLDKDTLTRPLVEQMLIALGGDRDDRNTDLYLTHVRPFEYRCLMESAMESLSCGVSTVITAPFLRELGDDAFFTRLRNNSAGRGAALSIIWVQCDVESMFDYLSYRGAARDRWKLANWEAYLDDIDLDFRPPVPHYIVDNRLNATITLIDQASKIARAMNYAS
jgi:predicted kinase/transcriptional regulator with XRE-family HTH domain